MISCSHKQGAEPFCLTVVTSTDTAAASQKWLPGARKSLKSTISQEMSAQRKVMVGNRTQPDLPKSEQFSEPTNSQSTCPATQSALPKHDSQTSITLKVRPVTLSCRVTNPGHRGTQRQNESASSPASQPGHFVPIRALEIVLPSS